MEHMNRVPTEEEARVLKERYKNFAEQDSMTLDKVITDSVLAEADALINGPRAKEYGDARQSFTRIADLWTATLGFKVTREQVAIMMVQLKISRMVGDIESGIKFIKRDSIVDAAGYIGLLEKLQ